MSTENHEIQVIGACLMWGRSVLDRVDAIVNVGQFSSPAAARVFQAMHDPQAYDDDGHANLAVVATRMGGEFADALALVVDVRESVPTQVNIEHHAAVIARAAQMRRLAALCRETAARLERVEPIDADPTAAADGLVEQALDIGQSRNAAAARHVREGLKGAVSEWKHRYETRDAAIPGFKSGLEQLDNLVTFEPGHVYLLGAASGHGKTALATHLADAASEQRCSVLDVTCEVPEVDLLTRLIAGGAKIDSRRLATGMVESGELLRMREAVHQRAGRDLYILDAPTISVPAIEREVRRTIKRPGNTAVGVVIVDYLQLVKPTQRHGNREQDVAEVADSLLELAKRQNVVVIVAAQLNRAGSQRSDKRPVSSDLRESSRAEHNATAVLMLYRPALNGEDGASETACEIIVRKNRKGPLGTASVHYDAATNNWGNLQRRYDGGMR